MKFVSFTLVVAIALFYVPALYAQGGCVDSPENPTALLAIAGMAGAYLSARLKKNKNK